jgi:hypothetical protein
MNRPLGRPTLVRLSGLLVWGSRVLEWRDGDVARIMAGVRGSERAVVRAVIPSRRPGGQVPSGPHDGVRRAR